MNHLRKVNCLTQMRIGAPLPIIRPPRPQYTAQFCAAPILRYSTREPRSFYEYRYFKQIQALHDSKSFAYLMTSLYFNSPFEAQSPVDGSPQPRWGWPIYRTAYGNDAVDRRFARFIRELFSKVEDAIDRPESAELKQLMDFPVFQGAHLDALSSTGVRLQFENWALKRGVPRLEPRPGDPELPWINGNPAHVMAYAGARFKHCLMVDRRSLNSLDSEEPFIGVVQKNWQPEWHPTNLQGKTSFVVDERYDIIEGNPSGDLGWWYMPLELLVEEYDGMSKVSHYINYHTPRPPDVYTSSLWCEETWKGDEEEGHSRGIEPCNVPYTYEEEV